MKLIKDYMLDETLRAELNELSKETFWIDFEAWVTEGYFWGDYIPYSYEKAVRNSVAHSALEQQNKYALQMFYTSGMEQIYYSQELDCYIAMQLQGDTLFLQSLIAARKISMEQILTHIPFAYEKLILGFTPCKEDAELFWAELYDGEEDYRFFFLGEKLKSIEEQKLYFPEFSHA